MLWPASTRPTRLLKRLLARWRARRRPRPGPRRVRRAARPRRGRRGRAARGEWPIGGQGPRSTRGGFRHHLRRPPPHAVPTRPRERRRLGRGPPALRAAGAVVVGKDEHARLRLPRPRHNNPGLRSPPAIRGRPTGPAAGLERAVRRWPVSSSMVTLANRFPTAAARSASRRRCAASAGSSRRTAWSPAATTTRRPGGTSRPAVRSRARSPRIAFPRSTS